MIAIITIGCFGSSELISILKDKKLDVINKPLNHLYPNELLKKFGNDIKVVFIMRSIHNVLKNIELNKGVDWIKNNYYNLNFEELYDSYRNTNIFPVLFIKYENLYCQNNYKTVNILCSFLNCKLQSSDFKNNNKFISLSEEENIEINKNFLSFENKINTYDTQLIIPPQNLINKIQLLKSNKHYRFGDVIFHKGNFWKESTKFILENDQFKNSILRNYIEKCPNNNLNDKNPEFAKLLSNIIKNKMKEKKYNLPVNNELVIHLRLGDVVVKDCFLKKNYKKIIEEYIKKYNIYKVTFCTAFHYGDYTEKNLWIYDENKHQKNISELHNKLNNLNKIPNIYFDLISSKNSDDDLIYMVNSKYFIQDEGGFSKLVSKIKNELS